MAIALGTSYLALQFRERAIEVTERELTNTALLLSRHFDQQLADLQHVHDDIIAYMQAGGVDTPKLREADVDARTRTRCCAASSRHFRMSAA